MYIPATALGGALGLGRPRAQLSAAFFGTNEMFPPQRQAIRPRVLLITSLLLYLLIF